MAAKGSQAIALAVAAAAAMLVVCREQLEAGMNYLAGRTPGWLLPIVVRKPWLLARPECAEGARCTFKDEDFLSPDNRTWNKPLLEHFFTAVAPMMASRSEAVAVALHRRYLRRLREGGQTPQMGFVFVGPNTLGDTEVLQLRAFDAACGSASRLVLVEPQEPIIQELSIRASAIGMGTQRTAVINAAMCPSAGGSLSLWKFRDGTAPSGWMMEGARQWSTLGGKDVLLNTWRRNTMFYGWPLELRHEDDLEDWVEEVPVKCHTASTLLQEVGMQVGSVDYLMIDAEGYDAEILGSFMDLPGFSPAVIIFEWAFHHASRGKLHMLPDITNNWSQRGYAVYKDLDNLVVFRTDGK